MMLSMRWKWQTLFSYAEVVCFITAWAVGLVVARDHGRTFDQRATARTIATTAELPGIQASLREQRR